MRQQGSDSGLEPAMPAPLSLRIKERYMAKRADGLSQQVAADAAGISVRSAQRIDRGALQPEGQQQQRGRHWRTRADPLAEVWESVLVPMLEKAPQLEPQTLLLHLEQLRPGEEWYRRKRTLQRRVEQWRALHGPAQEVMFLQEHRAGVLGISDFTLLKGEPITVAGEVLDHRLFHFRLPYSGWCHVAVIHGGESFIALSEALQNALALCGGVPAEHRTDSLSACFRNRDGSYAKDFTRGTPIVLRQLDWRRTIGDPQPLPRALRPPGRDRHPQQPRRRPRERRDRGPPRALETPAGAAADPAR